MYLPQNFQHRLRGPQEARRGRGYDLGHRVDRVRGGGRAGLIQSGLQGVKDFKKIFKGSTMSHLFIYMFNSRTYL